MFRRSRPAGLPLELSRLTEQPSPNNKAAIKAAINYLRQECEKVKSAGDSGKAKRLQQAEAMLSSAIRGVSDAEFSRTMAGAIKFLAAEWGVVPDIEGSPSRSAGSRPATSGGSGGAFSDKPTSKLPTHEMMKLYHTLLTPRVQQWRNASGPIMSAKRDPALPTPPRDLRIHPRARKRKPRGGPSRRTGLTSSIPRNLPNHPRNLPNHLRNLPNQPRNLPSHPRARKRKRRGRRSLTTDLTSFLMAEGEKRCQK